MLEGLERVFGALTFYLTESVQEYGGPQHFTREDRFALSSNKKPVGMGLSTRFLNRPPRPSTVLTNCASDSNDRQ